MLSDRTKKIFDRIDVGKKLIDRHRPLPPSVLQRLHENLVIDWTYNSNAIEGNTLSISETRLVLQDGLTIGRKSVIEHLEAINHRDAIRFIETLARNPELLALARESGCISLFIGFESLNQENLDGARKTFMDTNELVDLINRIQDHGIGIQGAFIFGFDHDEREVFKRTVDFVHETHIELPTFSVLTPFPGTPLRKRLEEEGRIFDNHWPHYDMSHVVFKPKLMSPRELQEGYLWAQKYCCSPRSILGRLLRGPRNHLFHFLMSNFVLRGAQMEIVNRLRDRQFHMEAS